MLDKKVFKNQGLVLKVSANIDPEKFDVNKYEPFWMPFVERRGAENGYKGVESLLGGRNG